MFIVTTGDIAAQPGTGKALKVTGGIEATSHITASGDVYVSGDVSGSATSTGSFGRVKVAGTLFGPTDDHFVIKSDKDVKLYLDTDDDGTFHKFQVYNEDGDVKFAVASDGKAAIGKAVHQTLQMD